MNRYERARKRSSSEEMSMLKAILKQRDTFIHDTGVYPPYIRIPRELFYKIMPIAYEEDLLDKVDEEMYRLAGMTVVFEDSLPGIPNGIIKKRGRTDE